MKSALTRFPKIIPKTRLLSTKIDPSPEEFEYMIRVLDNIVSNHGVGEAASNLFLNSKDKKFKTSEVRGEIIGHGFHDLTDYYMTNVEKDLLVPYVVSKIKNLYELRSESLHQRIKSFSPTRRDVSYFK